MSEELESVPAPREDLREAIARHRRAAWRVTAMCNLAYGVLAVVVAVGLAPLLYGIVGIALDAVNLVIPTPNLLHYAAQELDSAALARATGAHRAWLISVAALPGLLVLTFAAHSVRRALAYSIVLQSVDKGRSARRGDLAEARVVHTLEEMAIAAAIPTPRAAFLDGSVNGAAVGTHIDRAAVLLGAQLSLVLTRSQLQGVSAHLVASIANGDMAIGLRTACTAGVFSLLHRLGLDVLARLHSRDAFRSNLRLLRALVRPNAAVSNSFSPRCRAHPNHPYAAHRRLRPATR